jgi:hypothetical protein
MLGGILHNVRCPILPNNIKSSLYVVKHNRLSAISSPMLNPTGSHRVDHYLGKRRVDDNAPYMLPPVFLVSQMSHLYKTIHAFLSYLEMIKAVRYTRLIWLAFLIRHLFLAPN